MKNGFDKVKVCDLGHLIDYLDESIDDSLDSLLQELISLRGLNVF